MARLFLSFLGTSAYVPCNYCRLEDGRVATRVPAVRFVQTAVLKLYCAHFGAGDRLLIGCTEGAKPRNLPALRDEIAASGWPPGLPLELVALPDVVSESGRIDPANMV